MLGLLILTGCSNQHTSVDFDVDIVSVDLTFNGEVVVAESKDADVHDSIVDIVNNYFEDLSYIEMDKTDDDYDGGHWHFNMTTDTSTLRINSSYNKLYDDTLGVALYEDDVFIGYLLQNDYLSLLDAINAEQFTMYHEE